MARMEAAAVAAEVQSAKETLRTQTASFCAQEEASAKRVTEHMEGCVQALASHTKAETSRVVGEVVQ